MKVLFITPYITIDSITHFTRNKTGFGYMVHDIAQYVGKKECVDVFTANVFTPSLRINDFNVVDWSKGKFLRHIKWRYLKAAIRFARKYPTPFATTIRTAFSFLAMGYVEKIVKGYDMVHIHGCSPLTEAVIMCCKRKGVPYVVTLHGLNSFEDAVKLHPSMKQYERDFLKTSFDESRHLTFISSGNINSVQEYLNVSNTPTFHLVSNGCNIKEHKQRSDIRQKHNVLSSDFAFLFVGNVSKCKNQIQAARVFVNVFKAGNYRLLFVGANHDENCELLHFIEEHKLQRRLIVCGAVPKEDVPDYYMAADATILTSLSEGFGLSIIEGFVYGKPNLTFADLPAARDLYDECAMLNPKSRSDEDLAEAMIEMAQRKWDAMAIKQHAKNFSLENMANKYISVYKKQL